MRTPRLCSVLAARLAAAISCNAHAAQKNDFSVCWTLYAGRMPWEYGAAQGIVDKWAKKYAIAIDVVQINDYVASINQNSAGQFDGCTMTNMDALTSAWYEIMATMSADSPEGKAAREHMAKASCTDLLRAGVQSSDAIGMSFARGVTTGDAGNIKLRFDPSYMQMAADGKL